MRARTALFCVLLAALGCRSGPEPIQEVEAELPPDAFSGERAYEHLRALTEIGPRAAGTEGAAKAREYIAGEMLKLGLTVEEVEFPVELEEDAPPLALVNLMAVVQGASEDEIVLGAPYDTAYYESFEFIGANEGGSGAALVLELARVASTRSLPYTVRFVFFDGEARLGRGEKQAEYHSLGSSTLAVQFDQNDHFARIRLMVVFDRVGDADLRIARDLLSHRIYRKEFWRAAARLGRTDAFPKGAPFESVRGSHEPFAHLGLRKVVAIGDTSFGDDEAPGVYAHSEEDTLQRCSPESLAAVGEVTVTALEAIARRLAKIDRFSRAPLAAVVESAEQVDAPAEEGDGEGDAETSESEALAEDESGEDRPAEEPQSGETQAGESAEEPETGETEPGESAEEPEAGETEPGESAKEPEAAEAEPQPAEPGVTSEEEAAPEEAAPETVGTVEATTP